MTMDDELLKILACPETKEPVALAPQAMVEGINRDIDAGKVTNRGGKPVTEPIDAGLLRADGKVLYPVRNGIPVMLIEEAILIEES